MQKSDIAAIMNHFEQALDMTHRMRQLLAENGDMEVLGQMYEQRGAVLAELEQMRHFLPGRQELTEQWNKKTAQLVEADRELLSVFEVLKDTYQERVRQSNQQKYLLIYSKGQQYGY